MIKSVRIFNLPNSPKYSENLDRYYDVYVELVRKIPYLVKYYGYRILSLPDNDLFPKPEYKYMEELWWPDQETYKIALESKEHKTIIEKLQVSCPGFKIEDQKELLLLNEINILHPMKTGQDQLSMEELMGEAHIKTIWPLRYLDGESIEKREAWYLNHHTRVAARNFNLIRYVSYKVDKNLTKDDFGVVRWSEIVWRDRELMLNDFNSPLGEEVKKDNEDENGNWKVVTDTRFIHFPFVVGNQIVFK